MSLTGAVSLISFSLSAFLAILLWLDRERRPETRWLAALLAIHSLAFLLRYGFVSQSDLVVFLPLLVFPLLTLHGPLVDLFVRRALFGEGALTRLQRLPFILGPLVTLVVYALLLATVGDFRDREAILAQARPVALFSQWMILLFGVYNAIFVLRAVGALGTYRARFQASFSNLDNLRLEFLRAFLAFIAVFYSAYASLALLGFLFAWRSPVTPLDSLLLLGLTYFVLYYLVRRPQIFTLLPEAAERPVASEFPSPAQDFDPSSLPRSPELPGPSDRPSLGAEADREARQQEPERRSISPRDPDLTSAVSPSPAPSVAARQKYARQSLAEDTRRAYLRRIQDYMDAKQPYLDGDLALADLAHAVEIPKHHFSMVINIELGQNFFQFVNAYRVDAARRLLDDPAQADKNLLSIAYSAGFQSKAAFNKVFKRVTGQTPGQYRAAAARVA